MKIRCDGSCGCKGEIVELTHHEQLASEEIERLMDEGVSLVGAVNRLRGKGAYVLTPFGRVSSKFWEWKLGVRAKELV